MRKCEKREKVGDYIKNNAENTLTAVFLRDIMSRRATGMHFFCAYKYEIATAQPHENPWRKIIREVKWNANIQQLVRKGRQTTVKKSTAQLQEDIQLFKKDQ